MVRRFTNPDSGRKILFGNDTDVSDCIITKFGDDIFLFVSIFIDEERERIQPTTITLNKEDFKKHFDLQYGSPMHYISKEDFEWMTS
jgi:hypothetical protein